LKLAFEFLVGGVVPEAFATMRTAGTAVVSQRSVQEGKIYIAQIDVAIDGTKRDSVV